MRRRLVEALAARLPFYYGWVVLACVCAAAFSRPGTAVATLSIFIAPMTREFGWSHTEISAAVSVGGVLGALVAPAISTVATVGVPGPDVSDPPQPNADIASAMTATPGRAGMRVSTCERRRVGRSAAFMLSYGWGGRPCGPNDRTARRR